MKIFLIPTESLKLHRNIDKYELLNHANATDDDKNNFSYTKVGDLRSMISHFQKNKIISFLQKSLDVLGLNQDEILSIFKVIAVVIKLGNLVFVPTTNIDGTEGCNISNEYGNVIQNMWADQVSSNPGYSFPPQNY